MEQMITNVSTKLCEMECEIINIKDEMKDMHEDIVKLQKMLFKSMMCLQRSFDMLTTGTLNLREEVLDEIDEMRTSLS